MTYVMPSITAVSYTHLDVYKRQTLAKHGTVERKWYIIDAAGKPLGRTAATAAVLLRGKNKVTFTPVSYTHLAYGTACPLWTSPHSAARRCQPRQRRCAAARRTALRSAAW